MVDHGGGRAAGGPPCFKVDRSWHPPPTLRFGEISGLAFDNEDDDLLWVLHRPKVSQLYRVVKSTRPGGPPDPGAGLRILDIMKGYVALNVRPA